MISSRNQNPTGSLIEFESGREWDTILSFTHSEFVMYRGNAALSFERKKIPNPPFALEYHSFNHVVVLAGGFVTGTACASHA